MARAPALVALLLLGGALACGTLSGGESMKRCFSKKDGERDVILVIEDGQPQPSITVYERLEGKDLAPPMKTYGRLEPGAFVYADGTRLVFDDQRLTWPENSLLAGAVYPASACP